MNFDQRAYLCFDTKGRNRHGFSCLFRPSSRWLVTSFDKAINKRLPVQVSNSLQWRHDKSDFKDGIHGNKISTEALSMRIWTRYFLLKASLASARGTSELIGEEKTAEQVWLEFFSHPSQWWDHRFTKINPRFPDFKHKRTEEPLWIDRTSTPEWVKEKLATLSPGTLQKGTFSWNTLIAKHLKDGRGRMALQTFQKMQAEGIQADKFTYIRVLKACILLAALENGRHIHAQIIEDTCSADAFVGSCLIDLYAKCRSIEDASRVFNNMSDIDVVSWNALIMGYMKCGQAQKALELFNQMQREAAIPTSITLVGVLNACATLGELAEGRSIHAWAIQLGFETNIFVRSSLVDMYSKCGSVEDACRVFNRSPVHNVVCWNTMISGYVKDGQGSKAINLYQQMELEHVVPNAVTFVGALSACAKQGALQDGRLIHLQAVRKGCDLSIFVGSCLVDMYCKCCSLEDACRVFNNMPARNALTWSAIILGYVRCGEEEKALALFQQMQWECVEPTSTNFLAVLSVCAGVGALQEGRRMHAQVIRCGCESDVFVGSSLIDMYSKCGSIEEACRVFNTMPVRNVICWNAMLNAYANSGTGKEALHLFEQMCQEVKDLNAATFVSLLSACSNAGLVDESSHYFECMDTIYGTPTTAEHHSCMVGILGRAGYLQEAQEMIDKLSSQSSLLDWTSLLAACQIHGNSEMGEHVVKQILQIDPENASALVQLSNIYSAAGLWDRKAAVQEIRKERHLYKQPGCSWIADG